MSYTCKSPDCDHEFEEDRHARAAPLSDSELPFYTVQYESESGIGVRREFVCSRECMERYMESPPEVTKA